MRALALAATRLVPLVAGAGVSIATVHTLVGTVTAISTAIYTVFLAAEAGFRVWEKWQAYKAAQRSQSPRTKADA